MVRLRGGGSHVAVAKRVKLSLCARHWSEHFPRSHSIYFLTTTSGEVLSSLFLDEEPGAKPDKVVPPGLGKLTKWGIGVETQTVWFQDL